MEQLNIYWDRLSMQRRTKVWACNSPHPGSNSLIKQELKRQKLQDFEERKIKELLAMASKALRVTRGAL